MKRGLFLPVFAFGRCLLRADDSPPVVPDDNIIVELQMVTLPNEAALPLARDLKDPKKVEASREPGSAASAAAPAPVSPAPPAQWRFSAECRMIALPRAAGLALLARVAEPGSGAEAWRETERLLESGEATLAADLGLNHFVSAAKTESTETLTHPTDFESPPLPRRLPPAQAVKVMNVWPFIGAPVTAFNTEKFGQSLELEAVAYRNGRLLQITFHARDLRFQSWQKFDFAEAANGKRLSMAQPVFHNMESRSTASMINGEKLVIGAHALPNPEQGFEFFLLQVTATPAG